MWDLKVIYQHGHPYEISENSYGGTIDVYPVSPRLEDIIRDIGAIPHVYWSMATGRKEYYICTVRPSEFKSRDTGGKYINSSAATCLSWACKWIVVFELWLNGDVGDEAFEHTY